MAEANSNTTDERRSLMSVLLVDTSRKSYKAISREKLLTKYGKPHQSLIFLFAVREFE